MMANEQVTPASRRGKSRAGGLVTAITGWSLLAAFMTLARVEDAIAAGRQTSFLQQFVETLPYFVPLMALSWGLMAAFERWPTLVRQPVRAASLFAVVLLIYFPLYILFQATVALGQSGTGFDQLGPTLSAQSRFGWWIDGMIIAGATAFHLAVASWRRLVDRDIALQLERGENLALRLTLLQAQLEPHFLFNALNSISALVRSGDRELALHSLSQVSDLLRYALRASRVSQLSLRDELDFLDRYLTVQSLRHGDRLVLEKHVADEDWTEIACPPLLLQPLVENALRYGVESTVGISRMGIDVSLDGDTVRVRLVNDIGADGGGAPGNGMGVNLVRERLAAVYGTRAALNTLIEENRFVATLEFPADDYGG
jgi:hypothetical protein